MRRGSLRAIFPDSTGRISSRTLSLGMLAANFRSLLLSVSARTLNSEVTILRSSPLALMASVKILILKPIVKYLQCFQTAFSYESNQWRNLHSQGLDVTSPRLGSTKLS